MQTCCKERKHLHEFKNTWAAKINIDLSQNQKSCCTTMYSTSCNFEKETVHVLAYMYIYGWSNFPEVRLQRPSTRER